jgi:hypothetical protein
MRSNVGQAKPRGERDSYRAEDHSRRLYARWTQPRTVQALHKGSQEDGAEPANSSDNARRGCADFRPGKASISEKLGCLLLSLKPPGDRHRGAKIAPAGPSHRAGRSGRGRGAAELLAKCDLSGAPREERAVRQRVFWIGLMGPDGRRAQS